MNIVDTKELQALVKRADLSKPLFCIPMTRLYSVGFANFKQHSDEPDDVECYVTQERYRVEDGYKVELVAVDARYGKESLYLLDLATMINQGSAKVLQ